MLPEIFIQGFGTKWKAAQEWELAWQLQERGLYLVLEAGFNS